jgi:hypothetical protein
MSQGFLYSAPIFDSAFPGHIGVFSAISAIVAGLMP